MKTYGRVAATGRAAPAIGRSPDLKARSKLLEDRMSDIHYARAAVSAQAQSPISGQEIPIIRIVIQEIEARFIPSTGEDPVHIFANETEIAEERRSARHAPPSRAMTRAYGRPSGRNSIGRYAESNNQECC